MRVRMEPMGDRAVLVCFDEADGVPAEYGAQVERVQLPWVADIVPACDTLTIVYDPWCVVRTMADISHTDAYAAVYSYVEETLGSLLIYTPQSGERKSAVIDIPVRYGGEDGPDLAACAARAGMDAASFTAAHAGVIYMVTMIGFMPGFPYLSGLSEHLAQPRLPQPRKRIPAGSVGIAGNQTGIYPFDSPGGWQIIGRTSTRLFDASNERPSLLRAGDRVRFVPIEAGAADAKGAEQR